MKSSGKLTAVGLVVTILSVGVLAHASQPVNLLSNGGFEEGLAGWDPDSKHSLATEPGLAHLGKACLTGEVSGPSQAAWLRRRVPVKANCMYRFEVWARATNKTKLVLWAVKPGAKNRELVGLWEDVPHGWRRYTAPLAVRQSGTLELMVLSPSSYTAPTGRMWIDDLALYETEFPPLVSVSEGIGFNDEPAMAKGADGSVYVAWNSFRDGADSLQVARFRPEGKGFKSLGTWQVLGGRGTYILGVRAVTAGPDVIVLYAAENDKNWDVYTVSCGPDGPGQPVAVTSDAAIDVKPAAARHDGTLWVAWESNREGWRQIFAASVRDGNVSEPVAVSRPEASCYAPSVAVLTGGEVCVAWHSFQQNNYDVYLRRKTATGGWSAETRLTRAPSIDRHPVLLTRGDELWLVYENAQLGDQDQLGDQIGQYRVTKTSNRRLIVAKVAPQGLLAPKHGGNPYPLFDHCEAACASFDTGGRLWVAFLKPQLRSGSGESGTVRQKF